MNGLTELIDCRHLLHPVSRHLHHLKIPCKTGHLAGNINDPVHSILKNFRQCFRMDTISRRIKDDHIRLLLDLVQHLKYIACYEFTIRKSIAESIFFCSFYCLLDDLHTNHFLCNRSQHLTDRSGSTEQIKNCLILNISDVFPDSLIQYLCSPGIWLEERKRGDLKLQSEQLFIKEILTIKDSCLITFYNI